VKWLVILAGTVGSLASLITAADEPQVLDAASAEALSKTQEVLRDPDARGKFLREAPAQAAQVDRGVESMVGGDAAKKEEVYDLAADVFQDLVRQSGGDPAKMSEILQKASAIRRRSEKR